MFQLMLPCRTSGGIPLGTVRFELELQCFDERLVQVLRIVHHGCDCKVGLTVRVGHAGEVLCHARAFTVGNAMLKVVPGLDIGRDGFKLAATGNSAASSGDNPFGNRMPLQTWRSAWPRLIKMKRPNLHSGVRFYF